ncbi:hypothetical protein Scep_026973 [Stephania cephalantha]|uniref:Replication factor C subunit 3 n=1 Tax=Stephania cephalantha TaxID=152367 RepID=A0AAP0HR01_9MAGN
MPTTPSPPTAAAPPTATLLHRLGGGSGGGRRPIIARLLRRPITKTTHNNNLDLTTESLQEWNRRTSSEKKKNNDSPYYNGLLTDPSSASASSIHRNHRRAMSSPGRESRVTVGTTGTAKSSISSVLMKIHEGVASCFHGKSKRGSNSREGKFGNVERSNGSVLLKKRRDVVGGVGGGGGGGGGGVVVGDGDEKRKIDGVGVVGGCSFEQKPLREIVVVSESGGGGGGNVVVAKRMILVEEKGEGAGAAESAPRGRFGWADKYRPMALKDFICNRDKAEQLHAMVKNGQCNHFIFEGLPGVGKKTMIWAYLREACGQKLMTWKECKEFELKGELVPSIKVNVIVSSKHIEINLSELNGYEKHVIVELIKETHNIISNETMNCDHTNCHAVILHEADKLSTDAQLYIRWLMEKNESCNRIFFCCTDATKLQHIRPLCTVIQLLPPSNKEIVEVLEFIAKNEGLQLPPQLAERMANSSLHNLRQAIRSFEASWQANYPFTEDQEIMTGWEEDTENIAKDIIQEQSPKQLYIIRGKLQNLIEHNVCPIFTFNTLITELKKHLSDEFHAKINALFQEYYRDCRGNYMDFETSNQSEKKAIEESLCQRIYDLRKPFNYI